MLKFVVLSALLLVPTLTLDKTECQKNAKFEVYKKKVTEHGYTFDKTYVNDSVPVHLVYTVQIPADQVKEIKWQLNDRKVTIDTKTSSSVYYSKEEKYSQLEVTLNFNSPKARFSGVWALTVETTDSNVFKVECWVTSPPVLVTKLIAVRGRDGYPMTIECETESFPPPTEIEWKRVVDECNSETGAKSGRKTLVPVTNATFKDNEAKVKNGIMEWKDVTDRTGVYMCRAESSLGTDMTVFEVRVKSHKALLWPCIGILIEALVLVITILVYERNQAKKRKAADQNFTPIPNED